MVTHEAADAADVEPGDDVGQRRAVGPHASEASAHRRVCTINPKTAPAIADGDAPLSHRVVGQRGEVVLAVAVERHAARRVALAVKREADAAEKTDGHALDHAARGRGDVEAVENRLVEAALQNNGGRAVQMHRVRDGGQARQRTNHKRRGGKGDLRGRRAGSAPAMSGYRKVWPLPRQSRDCRWPL